MNQKYGKYEFSTRIIILAVVTMICSLIACIVHVYDIRNTYLTQHKNAYLQQVTVARDSMGNQILDISERMDEMGADIQEQYDYLSTSELYYIVAMYQDAAEYSHVSFRDESGNVYISDSSPIFISEHYELNQTEDGKTVRGSMVQDTDSLWTFFSLEQEVWDEEKYIGTLTCYFNTTEIFDESTFEFLTNDGYSYITDFQNVTLSLTDQSEERMGNDPSFANVFEETFGDSDATATFYHDLYGEIDKNEIGVKYITAENGIEYLFAYQLLDKSNNTYLVTYYNVEEVLSQVHSVVYRTAVTCIIIIVLMLILIIFVWLSSMRMTSLIEKMAYEDVVTKGKNLNYFKVRSYDILKTYRAFSYLVERFDIANFRYINEAYGHNRADELLRGCLQIADEVFLDNELCARMDSDQFVLLTVNDSSNMVRWATYKQKVNEFARTIGIKYPIRFKVGVYQIREFDKEIDMMIDRANAARKLITSSSKEMLVFYSDSIVDEMRRIDRIESDMMRALHDEEFQVYLQQKWDIGVDRVCGAEALIRWSKPDGTVILPGDFIPLFEKNGFIEHLDYYVLETVCAKQKDLLDQGKKTIPISVNQSKVLLNNSDYVRNVERIFNRYKIPRDLVVLEVTESVFLNDEEAIENIVQELKDLGISVSMDDFGKGFSSLNLLKNISFDILKIDKGFVSDSLVSAKSRWILRKIIEMADGLGMAIVCEGIETKEQLENVRKMGCQIIQGFYFGKPIPMEEFIKKFLEEK